MKGREASVAARLKNAAIKRGVGFQYATLLYMQEGLLRRLAASPYRDRFALKGGLLLQCLTASGGRTTKDVDLLGLRIDNDAETLKSIFASVVQTVADDALRFDEATIEAEPNAEDSEYRGVRILMTCCLGTIRNGLQIDIGFGDAVDPPPRVLQYPILVDGSAFSLYAYPLAVVVAEKFEAMIALAEINSRMKDFWDTALILERFDVPDVELAQAMKATFAQRETPMPESPYVFSPRFADSERAKALWASFLKRTRLPATAWEEVLATIDRRLRPLYEELRGAG